jgi:hypothetical protein
LQGIFWGVEKGNVMKKPPNGVAGFVPFRLINTAGGAKSEEVSNNM